MLVLMKERLSHQVCILGFIPSLLPIVCSLLQAQAVET
jgi:hypothetical protein